MCLNTVVCDRIKKKNRFSFCKYLQIYPHTGEYQINVSIRRDVENSSWFTVLNKENFEKCLWMTAGELSPSQEKQAFKQNSGAHLTAVLIVVVFIILPSKLVEVYC